MLKIIMPDIDDREMIPSNEKGSPQAAFINIDGGVGGIRPC
ncbi:hypothetical protein [Pararhizobium antarcticum]|nr:hypothetical protein [Pararhizobium antarcticum]